MQKRSREIERRRRREIIVSSLLHNVHTFTKWEKFAQNYFISLEFGKAGCPSSSGKRDAPRFRNRITPIFFRSLSKETTNEASEMKESKRRNVPELAKSFHTSSNESDFESKDGNDSSSENRMFPSLFILFSVFELARFLAKKKQKVCGRKGSLSGFLARSHSKAFFHELDRDDLPTFHRENTEHLD